MTRQFIKKSTFRVGKVRVIMVYFHKSGLEPSILLKCIRRFNKKIIQPYTVKVD